MERNLEADFKSKLEHIKYQLLSLSQNSEVQNEESKIISWSSDSNKIIKILSYPLLKSLIIFDWSSIFPTIQSDLTSNDNEINFNAIKILYKLPIEYAIKILKENEKEITKIINSQEFHYERILCLHDFLIKTYFKLFNIKGQEDRIEDIIDIYKKMTELVFSINRDISRNCMEIFINIYSSFSSNCADINGIDHYFDGNGSNKDLLKYFILKLTNEFIGKIDVIFDKIQSFEMRFHI